ncbi:MerR family transcriptional regulator [Pseudonocardia sp. CA-107938]|uniref:MerR family transcriptional regulator n=1 Tax=Pseudonocardia sp. CA-107938 TaxID=3240021 RepID=UPI003D935DE8
MSGERLYSISAVAEAFDTTVSALRYYEQVGLVPATARRARVRFYDRAAVHRLAFVQLWHNDAMMSLDDTAEILAGPDRSEHWRELVSQRVAELTDTIERLTAATAALEHLLGCPRDDPLDCPVTGKRLDARVDTALARIRDHKT